jgi:prepilin-type N-terminal cleavage/methylation domain-containing protein
MMVSTRKGFTLLEQVIGLAIMLVIGAAVVPYLVGGADRTRVSQAATSLSGIVDATTAFNRDVRGGNNITPFPGRLSHLTRPIAGGDGAYLDICGGTYSAGNAAAWKGPYLNRDIPAAGLPVAIGTARDSLVLVLSEGGTLLAIEVMDVTVEDARALSRHVDNDDADTPDAVGSVRWTPAAGDAEGRVTLHYLRPVPAC